MAGLSHHRKHRPRAWRLCRRRRLGRRLQHFEEGRVQRQRRSKPDNISGRRCGRHAARIAQAQGPVVLVGHSYGGAVITEAGTDPKVAGLVYITAFAPDKGESVESLIKNPPPGAPVPPILPPLDGYPVPRQGEVPRFVRSRCQRSKGRVPGRLQVPWGVEALSGPISEPAWKSQAELVLSRPRTR